MSKRFQLAIAVDEEEPADGVVKTNETTQRAEIAVSNKGKSYTIKTEWGDVTLDDLEPIELLGQGSCGVVHKAIHRKTGKIIALKDISIFDAAKRNQIVTELETLHASTCPYLVGFIGAFYNEGSISIALEFMEGGSLDDIYKINGRIEEGYLSQITDQVLKGLHYLHKDRHMVHRDIKPSNILMNSYGEFKISDFGVSSELDDTMAECATFVGTVTYMSPERLGGQRYSYGSDIWSLGLTILECATGEFPFKKDDGSSNFGYWDLLTQIKTKPPPQLRKELGYSPEICDFVKQCLTVTHRRPTAQELLDHPFITKYRGVDIGYTAWTSAILEKMRNRRDITTPAMNQNDIESLLAANLQL